MSSTDDINATLQSATLAHKSGQYKNAEKLCLNALKTKPGDLQALQLLARIAIDDNDPKKAAFYMQKCSGLLPDPDLYLSLGMLFQKHGDYAEATNAYRSALAIDSISVRVMNSIVLLGKQTGKYGDARKIIMEIGNTNPAVTGISACYFRLYEDEITALSSTGSLSSAIEVFFEYIKNSNYSTAAFAISVSILNEEWFDNVSTENLNEIDALIVLGIKAMGYKLSARHNEAKISAMKMFGLLHNHLEREHSHNNTWRLLGIATDAFEDKHAGNLELRKFLDQSPKIILHSYIPRSTSSADQ
jgi:tetratricopeptide (TPR) repeat protein